MYISKKYSNPLKVDYFDRKGELLKVAKFSGYKMYKINKRNLWRPEKIHMKNIQTKKESIFSWRVRTLGVRFKKSVFNPMNLK